MADKNTITSLDELDALPDVAEEAPTEEGEIPSITSLDELDALPDPDSGAQEGVNEGDYTDLGLMEAIGEGASKGISNVGNALGMLGGAIVSPIETGKKIIGGAGAMAQAAYEDPIATFRTAGRVAAPAIGAGGGAILGSGTVVGAPIAAVGGAAATSSAFERLLDGLEALTGYDFQDKEYKNTSFGGMASQVFGELAEGATGDAILGGAFGAAGKVSKYGGKIVKEIGEYGATSVVAREASRNPLKSLKVLIAKADLGASAKQLDKISPEAVDDILVRGHFLRNAKKLPTTVGEGEIFKTLKTVITEGGEGVGENLVDKTGKAVYKTLERVRKRYGQTDIDNFVQSSIDKYLPGKTRADLRDLVKDVEKPLKLALAKSVGVEDVNRAEKLLFEYPKRIRALNKEISSLTNREYILEGADPTDMMSARKLNVVKKALEEKQKRLTRLEAAVEEFNPRLEKAKLDPVTFWETAQQGLNANLAKPNFDDVADSFFLGVRESIKEEFSKELKAIPNGGSILADQYAVLNDKYSTLKFLEAVADKGLKVDLRKTGLQNNPVAATISKVKQIVAAKDDHPLIKHFASVDRAFSGVKENAGASTNFFNYINERGLPNYADIAGNSISQLFTPQASVLAARGVIAIDEYMRMYPQETQRAAMAILQVPQRMRDALYKVAMALAGGVGASEEQRKATVKELVKDPDVRPLIPLEPSAGKLEGVEAYRGGVPLSATDVDKYFANLKRSGMNAFEISKRRKYLNTFEKFMPEASDSGEEDVTKVPVAEVEKQVQRLKAMEDIRKFKNGQDVAKFSRTSLTKAPDYGIQTLGFDMGLDDGFDRAYDIVLASEGGFVDDPDDSGGRTNFGVTQDTYNAYLKRQGLGRRDVKNIGEDEVREIYQGFWSESGADKLPWPLSATVFDAAINSGSSRAVKQLQKVLGVKQDGKIGPETLEALDSMNAATVMSDFLDERESFYYNLAEKRPKDSKYLKGWLNRVKKMRRLAGEDRMDSLGLKIA